MNKLNEETKHFDIAIIGAGPGGYETALYARKHNLTCALVEKENVGGTCLNVGCIPTKTYYTSAKMINSLKKSEELGFTVDYNFDFFKTYQRKEKVVTDLTKGIEFLLQKEEVYLYKGEAVLVDKNTIKIKDGNDTYISAKNIIIATGSSNLNIIKGWQNSIDSTKLLNLTSLPKKLVIIGGGVIGIEMASIFNAFGCEATVIEAKEFILPNIDREISRRLTQYLKQTGIKILTKTMVLEIDGTNKEVILENNRLVYDECLLAIGRKPNVINLELDKLGIIVNTNTNGAVTGIKVNDSFQTNIKNIYAIGDVTGINMLAHYATYSGRVAIDHILKIEDKGYMYCPNAIFTFPEIASVGITEEQAKERNIEYTSKKIMYRTNGKAVTINETDGFVKTIIDKDGFLIGCHIIGYDASVLIHEAMIIMNGNLKADTVKDYIFAHPTLSEIIKDSL